ncbi:MAG: FAD-dependent oxidoreductase, partial [Thermodesulfobacteriota bacterium]
VHLGNSLEEISASLRRTSEGLISADPYVVIAQQSLFDPTRAPAGRHTAWAYCHVPHGTSEDVTGHIEAKIERFAPGFKGLILAKHAMTARDMERYNPNYVGGDINGGLQDLSQLYARPVASLSPYRTSQKHVLLCSSATPPGGGVHGLCGYYAAKALLETAMM